MQFIPEILDQYVEDASFFWLQRDRAVDAHDIDLDELAELDERLEAQLDGLRLAGEPGIQRAGSELEAQGEAGELFCATVLAAGALQVDAGLGDRSDEARAAQELWSQVVEQADASPALSRAICCGLEWLPWRQARAAVVRLTESEQASCRGLALAAAVAHRRDPGHALVQALGSEEPTLRRQALMAAGALSRPSLRSSVRSALDDQDADCRAAAARAACLMGERKRCPSLLRDAAQTGDRHAAELVARLLPKDDLLRWIEALAATDPCRRLALHAAGHSGRPELVPWLLEQMKEPPLARLAGSSFGLISGADVVSDGLEADWPEGYLPGPTEDVEDEAVDLDPEEGLAMPDRRLAARWWHSRSSQLRQSSRLLLGKPVTANWLWQVLRRGRQHERHAAALELALQQSDRPLFPLCAPAWRQQRLMRRAKAAESQQTVVSQSPKPPRNTRAKHRGPGHRQPGVGRTAAL